MRSFVGTWVVLAVLALPSVTKASGMCEELMRPYREKIQTPIDIASFDIDCNSAELQASFQRIEKVITAVKAVPVAKATYENTVRPMLAAYSSFSIAATAAHTTTSLKVLSAPETVRLEAFEAVANDYTVTVEKTFQQSKHFYDQLSGILAREDLGAARTQVVKKLISELEANGVHLPEAVLAQSNVIKKRIAELNSDFRKRYVARLKTEVRLPLETRFEAEAPSQRLKDALAAGGGKEYVFTLAPESIEQAHFVLQYASEPSVRREFWRHFTAPFRGARSNRAIVTELVQLRTQLAQLLGFQNFASTVLPSQMVGSADGLKNFIDRLEGPYIKLLQKEFKQLNDEKGAAVDPWDVQFYAKRVERKSLAGRTIDDALGYFEYGQTLSGILDVVSDFYQLRMVRNTKYPLWNSEVQAYDLFDQRNGRKLGMLVLDLVSRPDKAEGGAFMQSLVNPGEYMDAQTGRYVDIEPIAIASANLKRPTAGPFLAPFRNWQSVIHEIGHAIHALAYRGESAMFSGVGEFPVMDFVELPSQLLENFLYEKAILKRIARDFQTGSQIPDEIVGVIQKQRALFPGIKTLGRRGLMTRFDYQIHTFETVSPEAVNLAGYLAKTNAKWTAFPYVLGITRIENNPYLFMHGYESKFHGYQYSEAQESAVMSMIHAVGIEKMSKVGVPFRDSVLSQGGFPSIREHFNGFTGKTMSPEEILKKYER